MEFACDDIADKDGRSIRVSVFYEDCITVFNKIKGITDFSEDTFPNNIKAFIQKSIANSATSSFDPLWLDLFKIRAVAYFKKKLVWKEAIYFTNYRPGVDIIAEYANNFNVQIISRQPPIRISKLVRNFIFHFPRLFSFFLLLKSKTKDRKNIDNKIALLSTGKLNLTNQKVYSDLFFFQQSAISGKNILYINSGSHSPTSLEDWTQLRKSGISALALNSKATDTNDLPIHTLSLNQRTNKTHIDLNKINKKNRSIIKNEINYYQWKKNYWMDLFKRNSVKVFFSENKYDSGQIIINDAINEIGGINIIWQRAYEEFPSPGLKIVSDVVFGFSQVNRKLELKNDSQIKYHVTVGYPGDFRFSHLRSTAIQIRNKLIRNGAQRIIAFFDENSAEDARWFDGHKVMSSNYEFLLNKILENQTLGLLIKPKKPQTLRRRLGSVAKKLLLAEKTGRCYVFEKGADANFPPAGAALGADIAIHSHLWACTAGFESALTGTPTLLMDHEKWDKSKLYKLGHGQVIFNNWKHLWSELSDYWDNNKNNIIIGDWSAIMNELDPYRDGKAAQRIGSYMNWLIQGFDDGLNREENLEAAAKKYCSIWGQDKIGSVGY